MKAKKGDWVRLHSIVLAPGERASHIPDDTREVPLEMWDKGFLLNAEASVGDEVEAESIIGRTIRGRLVEINPQYRHAWGDGVPEILRIGRQVRGILADEEA